MHAPPLPVAPCMPAWLRDMHATVCNLHVMAAVPTHSTQVQGAFLGLSTAGCSQAAKALAKACLPVVDHRNLLVLKVAKNANWIPQIC